MSDAPAVPDSPDLVVCGDGLARPRWAASDPLLREYYDTEWGMPVRDERGVFERLSLEAFQSGLSWATILRKRPAFREAFANFDPDAVAAFDDDDVTRLLADASIVRNRAKILAALTNARATVALREDAAVGGLAWCGPTGPLARPSPAAPPTSPRGQPNRRRWPRISSCGASGSWGPLPASRSWRPSGSSTPTCSARIVAAPQGSGAEAPERHRCGSGRSAPPANIIPVWKNSWGLLRSS